MLVKRGKEREYVDGKERRGEREVEVSCRKKDEMLL